jgi:hypothetical protein
VKPGSKTDGAGGVTRRGEAWGRARGVQCVCVTPAGKTTMDGEAKGRVEDAIKSVRASGRLEERSDRNSRREHNFLGQPSER